MPLSNIIRHAEASRMRLQPFAFTEADPEALYESDGALGSAKVIRAQEAARLPVHIFPLSRGRAVCRTR